MRGVLVLALVAVGLVGATTGSAGGAATSLRVSFWENGSSTGPPDAVWTLRCSPARGTLPRPARACAKLTAGGTKLFAPMRDDLICTDIYGGPQRALVVGSLGGKRVWVTFVRTNGCHISRWDRLSPWLLPPGGAT